MKKLPQNYCPIQYISMSCGPKKVCGLNIEGSSDLIAYMALVDI